MSSHGIFRVPGPGQRAGQDLRAGLARARRAPGPPRRDERRAPPRADGDRRRAGRVGHDVRDRDAAPPQRTSSPTSSAAAPSTSQRAIAAAGEAHREWSRTPWHERAAVLLRAAELLAGPWRSTLNASTMLNQSKTAHQAEIDAACESIDFFRFNVDYLTRIYAEQPISSPGRLEPARVPAARGLRLRGQPVQLHRDRRAT